MLNLKCDKCGRELSEPGALLFSPPRGDGWLVEKYHLCYTCWLATAAQFRPATQPHRDEQQHPPSTRSHTAEISQQILAIQAGTKQSLDSIQEIGATIASVNEIATAIAAAVEQQGMATAEIARNVQEAARGTQEVSSNIAGVSQAASETDRTATRMLSAANEISQQSDLLRTSVEGFFAAMRAS
jgi:hypothetical protein